MIVDVHGWKLPDGLKDGQTVVPVISWLQKIAIYETKARIFVIGSNNLQSRFRVLKIDRTEPQDLVVIDDKIEYNQHEIRDMLTRIDVGNRSQTASGKGAGNGPNDGPGNGLTRTLSAFGIAGFIRFLEGYYMILITKRRRVAQIGHHIIYKVEDTHLKYIPHDGLGSNGNNSSSKGNAQRAQDEAKYFKIFQNVDLSSNFYFSYSYDLSHTLQYNLTPVANRNDHKEFFFSQMPHSHESVPGFNSDNEYEVESSDEILWEINPHCTSLNSGKKSRSETLKADESSTEKGFCGVRTQPNFRFVWNESLLKEVDLHPDWLLYMIHGFVVQTNICVFGRPLYLTLIARRSQKFAGTRFLKRGITCQGDVANEVETEQIVHDASISSFHDGKYTSFVQMRGSIPAFWSQDITKMVAKPAINITMADPYNLASGHHFNDLLYRYGSPVIILNLVKKREKKPQESVLSDVFISTINYLNQFLPPQHKIIHVGFDMARINKSQDMNVMARLADIAYHVIRSTGLFTSWPQNKEMENLQRPLNKDYQIFGGHRLKNGQLLQTGIVRVNCVDCLDRTNTAQFVVGKVALAYQLYALGALDNPNLEFETDTVRMLEELYEDHGDTLALQYGGSQVVHRIKTYRKVAPLASHSRDIIQTLSRYYSNTFSDADRQNAMNLFLGIYRAAHRKLGEPKLWELISDIYLHNNSSMSSKPRIKGTRPYTMWWDPAVAYSLPRAAMQVFKGLDDRTAVIFATKLYPFRSMLWTLDERVDGFYEQYRPYELSVFADTLAFNVLHTIKDFMPNFTVNYSPFITRARVGKRKESIMGSKNAPPPPPNPSISGRDSASSVLGSASEMDSESSDDGTDSETLSNFVFVNHEETVSMVTGSSFSPRRTIAKYLESAQDRYGRVMRDVKPEDLEKYKDYINSGQFSGELVRPECLKKPEKETLRKMLGRGIFFKEEDIEMQALISKSTNLSTLSHKNNKFSNSFGPFVKPNEATSEIHREYLERGKTGPKPPSQASRDLFIQYLAKNSRPFPLVKS